MEESIIQFKIASSLIGCGAVAAFIPAVPISVAIAGAIAAGITVI